MNPHRLRPRPRAQAAYLWLAAKRAKCCRDVRRLLYNLQLVQFNRDYKRNLSWDRFHMMNVFAVLRHQNLSFLNPFARLMDDVQLLAIYETPHKFRLVKGLNKSRKLKKKRV